MSFLDHLSDEDWEQLEQTSDEDFELNDMFERDIEREDRQRKQRQTYKKERHKQSGKNFKRRK